MMTSSSHDHPHLTNRKGRMPQKSLTLPRTQFPGLGCNPGFPSLPTTANLKPQGLFRP